MRSDAFNHKLSSQLPVLLALLLASALIVTPRKANATGGADPTSPKAGSPGGVSLKEPIELGQRFLAGLFDPELELLPEFRGSQTFWLYHDNYLAAHVLARVQPDLSRRIRAALNRFGVTNSGKIEIVFEEAVRPLPFRAYELAEVAVVSRRTIRTERVTTNVLQGWEAYADLLLLAAIAQAHTNPAEARRQFDRASAMWDGVGFRDRVLDVQPIYATYKLALYLIAANRLRMEPPHQAEVLKRLLSLQAPDGGWKTDFKADGPVGLANVETTSLSLVALEAIERSVRAPATDPDPK